MVLLLIAFPWALTCLGIMVCHSMPFWREPAMWTGDKVDFVGHGVPLFIHKGPDFFLIRNCRWISRRVTTGKAAGKRPDTSEGLCYEWLTPSPVWGWKDWDNGGIPGTSYSPAEEHLRAPENPPKMAMMEEITTCGCTVQLLPEVPRWGRFTELLMG